MSEPFTVLETSQADRRLLLKLQHRLLGTPPAPEPPEVQAENRRLSLLFALAPMAFAFLYLTVISVILFR